jgi:prolyl-tRNA synthetase
MLSGYIKNLSRIGAGRIYINSFRFSQILMENHSLKNLEDTVEFLKGTGMEYAMITHEAVPTVASMLENVIFEEETCMAKNLFLKDKKKKLNYLVVA